MINLLCTRNTDLTGYDFSNLTIRQAYLQGVNLQNVNFANSELTKCNFTKTLASVYAVALSPDGKLLAAGDANCNLYLWRVEDDQQLWSCEDKGRVWSIAFNNDCQTLVTLNELYGTKQWDVNTGQCLKNFQESDTPILGISCFELDDCTINNERAKTINLGASQFYTLAILKRPDPLGIWLLVVMILQKWDAPIKLRESEDLYIILKRYFKNSKGQVIRSALTLDDLKKDETTGGSLCPGRCLPVYWDRKCGIWTVAFSPDGQVMASGGNDHKVKLWKLKSGICIKTLEGHTKRVRSVTFSNDGKFIASGSEDRTIKIWDVDSKRCLQTLEHTSRVHFVTFIPNQDGQLLASASDDRTVKLWDFKTGKCLKTLQGYTNQVWSVAFGPESNSEILASGNGDNSVRLWDLKTGQCKKTLQGHTNSDFSRHLFRLTGVRC
ncbi:MAG: pentapeptide repeat-containing protein [Xenococcaceae cyanobacterium]